jgi:hypothetical protein
VSKSSIIKPDKENYDAIAKYLFKGTAVQARKQFQELLFAEWLQKNQNIAQKALPSVLRNESDILEKILSIIAEKRRISLKDLLIETKKFTTIKTQTELKNSLTKIKQKSFTELIIPKTLTGNSIIEIKSKKISQEDFEKLLKTIYDKFPTKMGNMVELPTLAKKITEETGLDEKSIYEKIFELYLSKIIDLQPGKPVNGNPLVTEEGSKFYWFQFR